MALAGRRPSKKKAKKKAGRSGRGLGRFPLPPAAAVASLNNERSATSALDRLGRMNSKGSRRSSFKLSPTVKAIAILGGVGLAGIVAVALAPAAERDSFRA
jgi:hypothetical protein